MTTTGNLADAALVILNGKETGNEAVREAILARRAAGHRVDVRVTWEEDDAARFVAQATREGYGTLVAAGGDGTLRAVAEAMALNQSQARLGLLPLGTANDFANAAGVPLEPAAALALLDGPVSTIDLVEAEGQLFLNMATGGFGSQVTANTPGELKRLLGGAAYLLTGLTRFAEVHSAHGRFRGPGFEWEGEFLALGIGNGRQAGGGHVLCPTALVNDGLLDIGILPASQDVLGTLGEFLSKGFSTEEMFVRARLPWVELEAAEGLDMNLDGEPVKRERVRFEVRPGILQVYLPVDSPLLGATAGTLAAPAATS
ncbi:lipid kinase YegS [Pseudomonas sp. EpS/L25]|uniref:lipid kinase YegS n=1 Tax=Pseudomonas sp. EpS/L25 TaxID=1749078 RepID=UPI0007441CF2|nr:lipid kinase YegS [Pseudomonas sp. EpS/L25]KUM44763.1 lipid kinase [Pseudomonas sp. EpS/L25]